MQEGVVGLLRALERYDAEMGTQFWAYASWWVRQAMQQVVSELGRPVVLSERAVRRLARERSAMSWRAWCSRRPAPFQIGDRVRFNGFGMDVEGTVAAHGLLYLTLTDGDDLVQVPNATARSARRGRLAAEVLSAVASLRQSRNGTGALEQAAKRKSRTLRSFNCFK